MAHVPTIIFWNLSSEFKIDNDPLICITMDWFDVSMKDRLTEVFMREHAHELYWNILSRTQEMSIGFMREYQSMLVMCDNMRRNIRVAHAKMVLMDVIDQDVLHLILEYV